MTKPTIEELRAEVRAPILTASDPGYDEARAVHNGMFDKRPEVIVRAEQAADVIGAVNFARDAGLDLSVKGGGHSAPGFGTNDGGVVIDLSLMRHVHVDPAARTARTGGGATWGDFNYATHAYGLATTGGIISTTGVGRAHPGRRHRPPGPGLRPQPRQPALGPGGHRRRSGANGQRPAERGSVLGAAGRRRQLRGGHVLRVPVAPGQRRVRGVVLLRAGPGREPVAVLPGLHQRRPRGVRLLPGLPDRPAACRSSPRTATATRSVWPWCTGPGPLDQGENAMKPFRDLAPVVAEMVGPMPYPALELGLRRPLPQGHPGLLEGQLRDRADRRRHRRPPRPTGRRCPRSAPPCTSTPSTAPAIASPPMRPPSPTATPTSPPSSWPRGRTRPSTRERIQWVRDYYAATAPHSEPGGYINFMDDDDRSRIKDNYKGNYDRLVAIKRTYDPDNLFHLNQNIPPSG